MRAKRKDKTRVTCYNYGILSHFTHDYTEPKKVLSYVTSSKRSYFLKIFISSTVLLTEAYPIWTVDLGATDYVARDKNDFMEFCQILSGTKSIYIGNNIRAEVKGIGIRKLDL